MDRKLRPIWAGVKSRIIACATAHSDPPLESAPLLHWAHRRMPARISGLPWRLEEQPMIRKLSSGGYRLYSRKIDPKTGKRRNLGTFTTRKQAEQHEREVQFFKR